ncbi:MAG: hypothetical protein IT208_11165 [Chthonomonadales bacterium]|nr:hypothetical protein [Chthonomonadales bacterium]
MARVVREGAKVYIEGVRRVTWDTGEMCEFASALVSAMQALGEDVPYDLVMGASGAAFRLTLNESIWSPGSFSIRSVCADPLEPARRAFRAVGRVLRAHEMGREAEDAAEIAASVERGVPVLAFGVVGPSDCSLVTGVDDGGATLLGWSTYQDIPDDHDVPPDATGYFRKPGWHANTRGYLLIGDPVARPPARQACIEALRWAAELARQPAVGAMPAGLDAYRVWAEAMRRDRDFPAADEGALGGPYLGILCNLMMVDDRRAAVDYLRRQAAEQADLATDLLAAAGRYAETCRLREGLRALLPEDFSPAAIRGLADPAMRADYAGVLLRMRDTDEAATIHIDRCLARLEDGRDAPGR